MTKLYFSDSGRVIASLCEELTDYRHARKLIDLPKTFKDAQLFILARAYPKASLPLHVSVNATEIPAISPRSLGSYVWYGALVPPSVLIPGTNAIEFWSDSSAMDSWSLGLEGGHAHPRSFVSTDGGLTWRNDRMGYLNVSRGEYVVRVRLAEGTDPTPPPPVWEDPNTPRLMRLLAHLPRDVFAATSAMEQVRSLMTWVSKSWEYRNLTTAAQLAPWDVETILAWGRAGAGHDGRPPIVMCVHYTVAFVTFCVALGIPARCAIFTGGVNGPYGHFTAEVWAEEFAKWVLIDPNMDAIFMRKGGPLSVSEVMLAGSHLGDFIQWGAGHEFQMRNPMIENWIREVYLPGLCFGHRSLWPRTDFLSHPELTPPHTTTAYAETELVWERRDLEDGFAMFRYFGDERYFEAPPLDYPYRSRPSQRFDEIGQRVDA